MKPRLNLRARLTIWYAVVFFVSLGASGLVLHFTLSRILYNDLDADLFDAAISITSQLPDASNGLRPMEVRAALRNSVFVNRAASPVVAVVRDASGSVIAGSALTNTDASKPSPATLDALQRGEGVYQTVMLPKGGSFRLYSQPVRSSDGRLLAIIQTSESIKPITSALQRVEAILATGGSLSILVSVAAGYWLSGLGLEPLRRVVQAAREIEASDLKQRLALRGKPAEVQELADTFDAMLARLDAAFDRQKRFVANVSHELRTPLTALRGSIDVMLLDESLSAETHEQLERLSAECSRLVRLASNVLYLAQSELGRLPERRAVDLDVLCLEVYMQMRWFRPELHLRLRREDQVTVEGDRDLLKQLLLNLVENGLKYGRPGDAVFIDLFQEDGRAHLVVEDTGPGIPAEDLPHVFEPFYRSRSTGLQAAGTGLGLAIARWVVELHNGAIHIDSRPGHGVRVDVTLPMHVDAAPVPAAVPLAAGDAPTRSIRSRFSN
jgi:heavy metal sensor kinase